MIRQKRKFEQNVAIDGLDVFEGLQDHQETTEGYKTELGQKEECIYIVTGSKREHHPSVPTEKITDEKDQLDDNKGERGNYYFL